MGKTLWIIATGFSTYGCDGIIRNNTIVGNSASDRGGIELTWKSNPGESYMVWSCHDLVTGVWIREMKNHIPSAGEITTWADADAGSECKFYRTETKQ